MEQTALRPEQAAKYLGVTSRCLQDWRVRKVGPAYVKAGNQRSGTVLYRRADLDAFLAAHLVNRTPPNHKPIKKPGGETGQIAPDGAKDIESMNIVTHIEAGMTEADWQELEEQRARDDADFERELVEYERAQLDKAHCTAMVHVRRNAGNPGGQQFAALSYLFAAIEAHHA